MEKDLLIICPNEVKISYLNSNKVLRNIKYMTLGEFFNNYYFEITDNIRMFLMKKYNLKLDVVNMYLKYIYIADKDYNLDKFNIIKEMRDSLIEEGLIKENKFFKDYLQDKNIIIDGYYELEMYQEDVFNELGVTYKEIKTIKELKDVYQYNSFEEEVEGVCLKIIELLNNGVDINKIFLTNVNEEDKYVIEKIFGYYNIFINLNKKSSIYSTKVVKDYLESGEIDLNNSDNLSINSKLVNTINSLIDIKDDSDEFRDIFINKLKNTNIKNINYKDAVNIKDFYASTFSDEEYIFVLSFNQDVLPRIVKDEEYISDKDKVKVPLYKSSFLNKRRKDIVVKRLSSINNLYLSYHLKSTFNEYYKSSIIDDFGLNIIPCKNNNYSYSDTYNKIKLTKDLDNYYLYNEISSSLKLLNNHYDTNYNSYSNKFSGINNSKYIDYLGKELILSYTNMNTYNECGFKYYVKNVLKLEPYVDTFAAYIGSLFHFLLQVRKSNNFSLEESFNRYLEKRELTIKERVLLIRLKRELKDLIESLNKQDLITGYNDELYETRIEIDLDKEKIDTYFKGFIDKVMCYKKIEDTYFSIVDYKTGSIDTSMEPIKYGLHMQLPVYLYLIHNYKEIKSPIFTGIYYQNILFDYPTYDGKSIDSIKTNRLKLQGYSTDKIMDLEIFDSTYEKSDLIKSLSYNEDKGFSRFSKLLNDDTLFDLLEFTKNKINEFSDNVLNGKFDINPKVYDKKNVSCMFCKFQDICFMKESDITYLEKVSNLDFLGGDEDA